MLHFENPVTDSFKAVIVPDVASPDCHHQLLQPVLCSLGIRKGVNNMKEVMLPIPYHFGDIAYFFRLNEENFLRTVDGTDYLVASALDYFEDVLDPVDFFRVNRQFL